MPSAGRCVNHGFTLAAAEAKVVDRSFRSAWKRASWKEQVERLIAGDRWTIDGNFGGTLEMRLAVADTIILLDLPPWLCAWRLLRRWLRFRGRSRPDMCEGCNGRIDFAFLWWVLSCRSQRLPALLS